MHKETSNFFCFDFFLHFTFTLVCQHLFLAQSKAITGHLFITELQMYDTRARLQSSQSHSLQDTIQDN